MVDKVRGAWFSDSEKSRLQEPINVKSKGDNIRKKVNYCNEQISSSERIHHNMPPRSVRISEKIQQWTNPQEIQLKMKAKLEPGSCPLNHRPLKH